MIILFNYFSKSIFEQPETYLKLLQPLNIKALFDTQEQGIILDLAFIGPVILPTFFADGIVSDISGIIIEAIVHDDWIRTAGVWCRKRQLYQLCQSRWPCHQLCCHWLDVVALPTVPQPLALPSTFLSLVRCCHTSQPPFPVPHTSAPFLLTFVLNRKHCE